MKQICSQIRGHNYFHGWKKLNEQKNYHNKRFNKKNETDKNELNKLKEKTNKKKIK